MCSNHSEPVARLVQATHSKGDDSGEVSGDKVLHIGKKQKVSQTDLSNGTNS